jgi:pimeloyl-ACP methyl ester carboxylesterase
VAIKHLKINGAEVTYREEGAGVPVVLLNGMLGDYRGWQRQVDALSPQYRVLALSQRYFPPNKWPNVTAVSRMLAVIFDTGSARQDLSKLV